jgi:hypothetical protein
MKSKLFFLSLLAGSASAAHAQTPSFGIKAGASLTTYTGGATNYLKNLVGFNGGVVGNFALNDAFSIQPELLYSMKGSKSEGVINGDTYKNTSRLHYLDVPVLARVNAGGLFFEAGPQVGFLLAAKQKSEVISTTGSTSFDTNIRNNVRSVSFGYAAGLGYQLSSGPGIGLRYNGDFTTVSKNGPNNMRNSAFQLYLSYMFGGK